VFFVRDAIFTPSCPVVAMELNPLVSLCSLPCPQVFFIRDGMKFPDMVHALKPNPKNHIQEGWRIADFFSHHPEAMHMVGWGGGVWEGGGAYLIKMDGVGGDTAATCGMLWMC
jgi:hypothetical protein